MSDAKGPEVHRAHDETASALGRLAQGLDGRVGRDADIVARDRFVAALGRRRSRAIVWVIAALCALAIAVVVGVRSRSTVIAYGIEGPAIPKGEWLAVPVGGGAAALRFSEGTEMELGPGSEGRVAETTAEGARVVLKSGALHARVVHRPRTHWTVEAGPYAIEVTGTAFDVGWSAAGEQLEVSLHDGSVVVRGPSLQSGLRVSAGQRLVVHARTGNAELSSLFQAEPPEASAPTKAEGDAGPRAPRDSEGAPEQANMPASTKSATSTVTRPLSWAELVSQGSFRVVLDAAAQRGVEDVLGHASLGDVVALSDAARYAGDRGLARRGLLAERARFAASPEAHAAAFVLGRLADDGGSPAEALTWYDHYLKESPRGAFTQEALGRRLVALVKLGQLQAARDAAASYAKRYPKGAHSAYAREVLEGP